MASRQNRRQFLRTAVAGSVALGLAGCTSRGEGSNYPSKDVRIIVPYSTGGGFDSYARIADPYWEEHLDTKVTVENIVGGGGVTGGTQAYNADPDGYTLLIWDAFNPVVNQIGRDVGYDMREMTTIGALTFDPPCIIAMNNLNLDGWDDFTSRISEFSFATAGRGTTFHTGPILLGEMTGEFSPDDLHFVHYGGTGKALGGLEKGEVDIALVGATSSGVNVVKALDAELFTVFSNPDTIRWFLEETGISTQIYSADLDVPNLDTFSEITVLPRAFFGPPDVPDDILKVQRGAFSQVINDQEFTDEALKAGRPVIDPGDHERISSVLEKQFEIFQSDPYKTIFKDIFTGST